MSGFAWPPAPDEEDDFTRPVIAAGIDPGPTTGIALLYPGANMAATARVFQCNASAAAWLLDCVLENLGGGICRGSIEPFIRGSNPGARKRTGRATADQVQELELVARERGVPLLRRSAGMVKPWAEGGDCKRLREAGLLDLVPGMPHAKSALGQALYCAVFDCGMTDPLSRKRSDAVRSG